MGKCFQKNISNANFGGDGVGWDSMEGRAQFNHNGFKRKKYT